MDTTAQMETPCCNICIIDQTSGLCDGCHRSLAEIATWSSLPATERGRIMADLPRRAAAHIAAAISISPTPRLPTPR